VFFLCGHTVLGKVLYKSLATVLLFQLSVVAARSHSRQPRLAQLCIPQQETRSCALFGFLSTAQPLEYAAEQKPESPSAKDKQRNTHLNTPIIFLFSYVLRDHLLWMVNTSVTTKAHFIKICSLWKQTWTKKRLTKIIDRYPVFWKCSLGVYVKRRIRK